MTRHVINEDRKVPPFTFLYFFHMCLLQTRELIRLFHPSADFSFQEKKKKKANLKLKTMFFRQLPEGYVSVSHVFKIPIYMCVRDV